MSILATVLISMPPAFLAGWLLAKVLWRLEEPGRSRQPEAADADGAELAALRQRLAETESVLAETRASFDAWRDRTRPVAKQFRQQRKVITELRDELRRRDAELTE